MIGTFQTITNILKNDSTLTATLPSNQIFVGPIDIVVEKQADLLMPQANIFLVSESIRTVPAQISDTVIQLDLWSRNNQMEIDIMYERILYLLNYLTTDFSNGHIYWSVLNGAADQFETFGRLWHRSSRFTIWQQLNFVPNI